MGHFEEAGIGKLYHPPMDAMGSMGSRGTNLISAEVRSIMWEEALEGPGSLINLPTGREGEQGG